MRSDWLDVNIEKASFSITKSRNFTDCPQMRIALELKFTQHPDLKQELLSTGNAELVEVRPPFSLLVNWTDHRKGL